MAEQRRRRHEHHRHGDRGVRECVRTAFDFELDTDLSHDTDVSYDTDLSHDTEVSYDTDLSQDTDVPHHDLVVDADDPWVFDARLVDADDDTPVEPLELTDASDEPLGRAVDDVEAARWAAFDDAFAFTPETHTSETFAPETFTRDFLETFTPETFTPEPFATHTLVDSDSFAAHDPFVPADASTCSRARTRSPRRPTSWSSTGDRHLRLRRVRPAQRPARLSTALLQRLAQADTPAPAPTSFMDDVTATHDVDIPVLEPIDIVVDSATGTTEAPPIAWRPVATDLWSQPAPTLPTRRFPLPLPAAPEPTLVVVAPPPENLVTAGRDWEIGNSTQRIEVLPETNALSLHRTEERWALADVRSPGNDFVVEVDVDLRSGSGFGVLIRAQVDADGRLAGYSLDVDTVYQGGGYLVRQWEADRELWNPIAFIRAVDDSMMRGRHTLRILVVDDRMTAFVDGQELLVIDSLDGASAAHNRAGVHGDRVGVHAWSSTELIVEALRVGPRSTHRRGAQLPCARDGARRVRADRGRRRRPLVVPHHPLAGK